LERGHRAVRGFLLVEHAPDGGFERKGEFADLQEARADAEQQPNADNADHRRHAPDEIVDDLVDGGNRIKEHG